MLVTMLVVISAELAALLACCVTLIYYLRRADLESARRGERRLQLAEAHLELDEMLEPDLRRIARHLANGRNR